MNENKTTYHSVSRNSICPCGSGQRFKKCHGSVSSQQKIPHSKIRKTPPYENDLFCVIEGRVYDLTDNSLKFKYSEETGEYHYSNDNQQYLFVATSSEARIQLDLMTSLIVEELAEFLSFEEHFENCSNNLGINRVDFNSVIHMFYQQRVLNFAQQQLKPIIQLKDKVQVNNSRNVEGICVRTCDSSEYLERILKSQIRRKYKFSANEPVYVFDDSSSEQSSIKNKQIVKELSDEIEVHYFGTEWQEQFVNSLVATFPEDKYFIRDLLLPQENVSFSGGRLINLALLYFAGTRYLCFDDDLILDDARLHENSTNSTIQLGFRPDRVFDGYDGEAESLTAGIAIEGDPLIWHKDALGLKLANFNNAQSNYKLNKNSLRKCKDKELARYGADSFIVTSDNGRVGTTVKRDAYFIFIPSYEKTTAPWESPNNFEQLLAGGYCWDSISQPELIDYGLCSPIGINNTQLLAPTIPTCKGEDILFCIMASTLHPHSVHLGFPWAMTHLRGTKDWEDDTYNQAKQIELPDLIRKVISEIVISSSATSYDRINMVSAILLNVVNQSNEEFRVQLISLQTDRVTQLINSLYEQIETLAAEDVKNKKIIERMIDNQLAHLEGSSLANIEDACGASEKEQIEWAREKIKQYANGLSIWPKLWDFCKNNRDQSEHY